MWDALLNIFMKSLFKYMLNQLIQVAKEEIFQTESKLS